MHSLKIENKSDAGEDYEVNGIRLEPGDDRWLGNTPVTIRPALPSESVEVSQLDLIEKKLDTLIERHFEPIPTTETDIGPSRDITGAFNAAYRAAWVEQKTKDLTGKATDEPEPVATEEEQQEDTQEEINESLLGHMWTLEHRLDQVENGILKTYAGILDRLNKLEEKLDVPRPRSPTQS